MLKIRRISCGLDSPIHTLKPIIQNRIVMSNCTQIALEMLDINSVEPDKGRIDSDI